MLFWELIRRNVKSLKFKIFIVTFIVHVFPIVCLFLFSKMHDYRPLNLAGQNIDFAPAKVTFKQFGKHFSKQSGKTSNKISSKASSKIYNKSKPAINPVVKKNYGKSKSSPIASGSVVNKSIKTKNKNSSIAMPLCGIAQNSQIKVEKISKIATTNNAVEEPVLESEQVGGILGIDLGLEIDKQENDDLLPWELILKDGLTSKFYQMKIMDDIIEDREAFFVTVCINNVGKATIIKQSGCKIPVIMAAITKALLEFEYPKELYGKTKEFKV